MDWCSAEPKSTISSPDFTAPLDPDKHGDIQPQILNSLIALPLDCMDIGDTPPTCQSNDKPMIAHYLSETFFSIQGLSDNQQQC